MNKADLIDKVAEKSGLAKKDVRAVVDGVFNNIAEFLASEAKKKQDKRKKVQIIGFGTFFARDRAPRKGVNPQTGAEITIPKKVVPGFKPGKNLKERVEG